MNEPMAVLIAAMISAIISVVAALLSHHYARVAAQTLARQSVVGADLKRLSTLTYEIVALSVETAKSNTEERFDEKLKAAERVAQQLDVIRREHRYSIPFIFEPLWHLKGLPLYVSHHRKDRKSERLAAILDRATALRKQLDLALEQLFFEGRHPSAWRRLRIKLAAHRLTGAFKDGKPTA